MTDMRATERLLEVIEEHLTKIVVTSREFDDETIYDLAADTLDVLGKLRRRGDTLVRAADLRVIMDLCGEPEWLWSFEQTEACKASEDRLENALGGKML